jgi:hypothetical protein
MKFISPAAQRQHDQADTNGRDGYLDPLSGLFVLTAGFLRRRGFCCGKGCRHCPYPREEQRRAGRAGSDDAE